MFMNKQECDVLKTLITQPCANQRELADLCGHSLGVVNRCVQGLTRIGYLDETMCPTERAREEAASRAPKNAVILAAGFGTRMVPINLDTPKALLEIRGERLIERLIRQLHESGITDITVVVGFMKEKFEYLIDRYGVKLSVNPDYVVKNNLFSLRLVSGRLGNTYVIPSDIRCEHNPFSRHEMYSWYMVSDQIDAGSDVRVNRRGELVKKAKSSPGNAMIGIAYLMAEDCDAIKARMEALCADGKHDDAFWEEALYENDRMTVAAQVVSAADAVEINTYEQLRDLDHNSGHLHSDALDTIARVLHVQTGEIRDIRVLKKGMTNRSFLFSCRGEKYIMRIPGEGTDKLINRQQEAAVYRAIAGRGLCDDPVYIDPVSGYKITRFLEGVRTADADNTSDLTRCMTKLRAFHDMKLNVGHRFDIFGQIDFYESLWGGQPSAYDDYEQTKANVFSLQPYIEAQCAVQTLTHIDAVADNFLFYRGKEGEEELQLTDWEYSGMQDPHVDIAMFCIYSLYNKPQCDRLIDIYFMNTCNVPTRAKIYAYIAACGLLWSNWCEYKRTLGVEFGEYSLRQYRFAKDFYRYAKELMEAGE